MHSPILTPPKSSGLGLDIAKAKLNACLLLNGARQRAQFDKTPRGLRSLLSWTRRLHEAPLFVIMESTGSYSPWLPPCFMIRDTP